MNPDVDNIVSPLESIVEESDPSIPDITAPISNGLVAPAQEVQDSGDVAKRTVYVTRIPEDVQEHFLLSLFKPFGTILSSAPNPVGVAFIFSRPEDAKRAAEQLDETILFGKGIHVKYASPPTGTPPPTPAPGAYVDNANLLLPISGMSASAMPSPKLGGAALSLSPIAAPIPEGQQRNLYILNLPLDMKPEELIALFEKFGDVAHCCILATLDGVGRRRAFIDMATPEAAAAAKKVINNSTIRSYQLDVSFALVQRSGNPIVRTETRNVKKSSFTLDPPSSASNRKMNKPNSAGWAALTWNVCLEGVGTTGEAGVKKEEIVEKLEELCLSGKVLEWDWLAGKLTFEKREDADTVIKALNGWKGLRASWWAAKEDVSPNHNWSSNRSPGSRFRSFSPMSNFSSAPSTPMTQESLAAFTPGSTSSPWSSIGSVRSAKFSGSPLSSPYIPHHLFGASPVLSVGSPNPSWLGSPSMDGLSVNDPYYTYHSPNIGFGSASYRTSHSVYPATSPNPVPSSLSGIGAPYLTSPYQQHHLGRMGSEYGLGLYYQNGLISQGRGGNASTNPGIGYGGLAEDTAASAARNTIHAKADTNANLPPLTGPLPPLPPGMSMTTPSEGQRNLNDALSRPTGSRKD
ncbi:hypothetical protein BT69DRAFT_588062 [Atractiella rhizophila]|nr:hypothetical protein BT69DRAFT_588062 [Atractiella rhizophila]